MFTPLMLSLLIVGLIIIVGLGVYAAKLMLKLKQQNRQQAEQAQAQLVAHKAHDLGITQSIIIIVRAMQAEQCDYAEGCWRLCVLLGSMKTLSNTHEKFPNIFAFYSGIKHLAILEERKKLSKQERMKQDLQRLKIESTFTPLVADELASLEHFITDLQTTLTPASV